MGDQLIRDPGIAAFELIKNAHDADASHARITMSKIEDPENGRIEIEDDGTAFVTARTKDPDQGRSPERGRKPERCLPRT